MGARLGLKASFLPKKCIHPVVRAGLGWNIATGDMRNDFDIGDIPATPRAVNYFGGYLEQVASSLSLIDHFEALTRGLLELRTLFFFVAFTGGWLGGGMLVLNQTKAS